MLRFTTTFLIPALWSLTLLAEAPKEVVYDEIPEKFEQYQDARGYQWQIDQRGAITSGATQYLTSGLKLIIDGKAVTPRKAKLTTDQTADTTELIVTAGSPGLLITRNFWFDRTRGGVRVIDTLTNPGPSADFKIELKTAFQFPWQNLVGTNGRIRAGQTRIELDNKDKGIAAKFPVADGRPDTLFIVRGGKKGVTPSISASDNSRELVFSHEKLHIPSGQKRSLVHWIIRRNVGQIDDLDSIAGEFYDHQQLIRPKIHSKNYGQIVNFDASAFIQNFRLPANIDNLVALNQYLEKIGTTRSKTDRFRVSANNQINGKLSDKAIVRANQKIIPTSKVAAISGGAGMGRRSKVYLRDGTVIAGQIELEQFKFKVSDDWKVGDWAPEEIDLLLLGVRANDGIPPNGTRAFVQLRTGEVIAIRAFAKSAFALTGVWGMHRINLSQLDALQYMSAPKPTLRIRLANGSSLAVLPSNNTLQVIRADGTPRTLVTHQITKIWKPNTPRVDPQLHDQSWIDLNDVPTDLMPEQGFLLAGNNLYSGRFSEQSTKTITLLDQGTRLDLKPSAIVSLRRIAQPKAGSLLSPKFDIEMINGDRIKGQIREVTLQLIGNGKTKRSWTLPTRYLIAYRSNQAENKQP